MKQIKNNTCNLLGISGKIGVGKDEVGRMIQYLSTVKIPDFQEYETKFIKTGYNVSYSELEIKKFADSLKDMTCILLGCTREELEDREFKDKELGEEWTVYSFSWKERGIINELYSTYPEAKTRAGEVTNGNYDSDTLGVITEIKMTPRLLMQLLGTDAGRNVIHPNVWVNSSFAQYQRIQRAEKFNYPNWIFTDVRFPNEVKAIHDKGGIVIKIQRPCYKCGQIGYHKMDCHPPAEHESETALDGYTNFDFIIKNCGSLEDLYNKVEKIWIQIKNS